MGLELHGGDCSHPHGSGVPLWGLQISARADVDRWSLSAFGNAGHGLYRTSTPLRPGRLLGIGDRCIYLQPHSRSGTMDRALAPGWPNYRWSDALTFLRTACVSYSWTADCLRRHASSDGPSFGNQ